MPGPSPRGHEDAAVSNARCESCHTEIAAEWRESQHRAAFRDPSFARAFLREPLPFCQGCHAPEGNTAARPSRAVADMGVACVTCHVVGGRILAAARATGEAADGTAGAKKAPHEIVRSASFGSDRACAGCHEFSFPDGRAAMQSTITEHRASATAGAPCSGCHMPRSRGEGDAPPHRSHGFAASHDTARLRSAIGVDATRTAPRVVRVTLTPRGVGHAFPTGDLFRRLAVYATTTDDSGHTRPAASRFLSRHFEAKPGPTGELQRSETGDDRVGRNGPGPTLVDLELDARAAGRAVSWRVAYERVQHFTSMNERDAVVTETVTLFEGELRP